MHPPGLIRTTAARGRILPVAPQINHIWIPESLVKDVFCTAMSKWTKCPRARGLPPLATGTLTLATGRRILFSRGFRTNIDRPVQTSHKSDNGNRASNNGSGSLFSWGPQLKTPPSFDYPRLSKTSPEVGPKYDNEISNLADGEADRENGSSWLFSKNAAEVSKHLFKIESGALVGFPPQVPYLRAKSPSEPWLLVPRDRLSELIIHDNLPPVRASRPSSRRAAIVDQQVQEILKGVLSPLIDSKEDPETVSFNAPETVTEEAQGGDIQQAPAPRQVPEPIANLIDTGLIPADTVTEPNQDSQPEGQGQEADISVADMLLDTQIEPPPASMTPPTITPVDQISTFVTPLRYRNLETSIPTDMTPYSKGGVFAPKLEKESVDFSIEELIDPLIQLPVPEILPTLIHKDPPTPDTTFDFINTISWEDQILPLQPPKILLPIKERLNITRLPSLEYIQSELLQLASGAYTSLESRVLIYSQIDTIYGIENLPDPAPILDMFLSTLHLHRDSARGLDLTNWFSSHPSLSRLEQKGLLSVSFLKEWKAIRSAVGDSRGYQAPSNRILDDPFRIPSTSIPSAWAMAKELLKRNQKKIPYPDHFPFHLATAKIFLDAIIKKLHTGAWDTAKDRAVATGIDIFRCCIESQRPYPYLVFSEMIRFLMAWKKHWSTPEFLSMHGSGSKAATDVSDAPGPKNDELFIFPDIPRLDEFFKILPREYSDRLACTILIRAIIHSDKPLSEVQSLKKIMTYAKHSPLRNVLKALYKDGGFLPFLKDSSFYEKRIASEGPFATARFLQGSENIEMISFLLRTWPAFHGVRYINDLKLLDEVKLALGNAIDRIRERINRDSMDTQPHAPGIPYAQAILSLFYLNLPSEGLTVGIFLALSHSKKAEEMRSCYNILSHFEGKFNGQVKFKIPKQARSIALNSFREYHIPWALELLMDYHNRHNTTFAKVLLEAADKYPDQTAIVFNEFLKPLKVTSLWNPQISFEKPAGWPSHWFLRELAIKYALSNNHYPTLATRRIQDLRFLYWRYGYGVSMKITRALVATAMIRTATHRLWSGPELTAAEDLFKHGRMKFAITAYMKDADRSSTYLLGLTRDEALAKKKEFMEKCIKEVWEEIFRWKKYRFAVATEKRTRIDGII
ncbi:hypothetical protein TWF730_005085 [Orbilia blumenaviensis]|uniref:ATPase expression protein 2, mitochondrial n=1 Tax=Orbilia blumenaviensis TaxID=1796055 RepID=A0AAV9VK37_9PEZI